MPKAKILVVEDDPFSVQLLKYNLRNYDADLMPVATSAKQAFEILESHRPDVALLDIMLDGKPDGIEIAAQINQKYDIPVVYITGHSSDEIIQKAKKTAPFGYLLKPYTPRELSVTLDMALYKHQVGRSLRESRATLAATLESLSDAVLACDGVLKVKYANSVAQRWFGPVQDKLLCDLLKDILPDNIELDELLTQGSSTGCQPFKIKVAQQTLWVEISARKEIDSTGCVIVLRDLTAYMKAQENFRQSQKSEAVGRLAGGVAHDFNNLLSVINSYADLLQMKLPPTEKMYGYAENIRTAGQRAAELVSKLLAFSRHSEVHPTVVDPKQLTEDSFKMLRRLIRENIQLSMQFDPQLGTVWADPLQIDQVLMNLCVNARDAIETSGEISIVWSMPDLSLEQKKQLNLPDQEYVCLAVSDSGCGIDPEIITKLFDPYFTTKKEGKGTGLGLAIIDSIVEGLHGKIQVESQLQKGTTFKIYFPVCKKDINKVAKTALPESMQEGKETILVVEDDKSFAECLDGVISSRGYRVVYAQSAEEAISKSEQLSHPPQLLISDMILPGMLGADLAHQLKMEYPHLKIIFMTGYEDALDRLKDFGDPAWVLQKPFSVVSVLPKLRQIIDQDEIKDVRYLDL